MEKEKLNVLKQQFQSLSQQCQQFQSQCKELTEEELKEVTGGVVAVQNDLNKIRRPVSDSV